MNIKMNTKMLHKKNYFGSQISQIVQLNLLLYLVFNSFFSNVPILYLLKTSFSRDAKWEHGGIEMELNKTPFL